MTWLYLGQHLKLGKEKPEKEKVEKVDTRMESCLFYLLERQNTEKFLVVLSGRLIIPIVPTLGSLGTCTLPSYELVMASRKQMGSNGMHSFSNLSCKCQRPTQISTAPIQSPCRYCL